MRLRDTLLPLVLAPFGAARPPGLTRRRHITRITPRPRAASEEDQRMEPTPRVSDRDAERRYEPPGLETILTHDELEREVLYAGGPISPQ